MNYFTWISIIRILFRYGSEIILRLTYIINFVQNVPDLYVVEDWIKLKEMKKSEPVSKIMSTNLITIGTDNTLFDAEKLFRRHKIRHIPVVNNKKIIGILSLTDLLRLSFVDTYGEDDSTVDTAIYNMLGIEQVMADNPVHVSSTKTIREVAQILAVNEFHALPVVDNGNLVGIVTTTDLLNYLLEQY